MQNTLNKKQIKLENKKRKEIIDLYKECINRENFSIEKCIYYSAIAVLIATSMLDNYFFDYGFERFLAVFITGLSICSNDKSIPVDEALN